MKVTVEEHAAAQVGGANTAAVFRGRLRAFSVTEPMIPEKVPKVTEAVVVFAPETVRRTVVDAGETEIG